MNDQIPALPPAMHSLLRYWKNARGEHVLPDRTAIDPIRLREWLPNLNIIQVHGGDKKFFVRVHSEESIQNMGQDFSRSFLEDHTSGVATDIALRPYHAAIKALLPVYSSVEAKPESTVFNTLDRLILPFTDLDQNDPAAPVTVDRFLCWIGPTDRVRGEDTAIYRADLPTEKIGKNGAERGKIQIMVIDVDDPRYGFEDPSHPIKPFAAQRPLAKQP